MKKRYAKNRCVYSSQYYRNIGSVKAQNILACSTSYQGSIDECISKMYTKKIVYQIGWLPYACIVLLSLATVLIGFDCGHRLSNITLLLLNISDCELTEIETNTEETYVQLLQLLDYGKIRI